MVDRSDRPVSKRSPGRMRVGAGRSSLIDPKDGGLNGRTEATSNSNAAAGAPCCCATAGTTIAMTNVPRIQLPSLIRHPRARPNCEFLWQREGEDVGAGDDRHVLLAALPLIR